MGSNLDLGDLPPDLQATLSKKETDAERWTRLGKDVAVFCLAILVVLAAFVWSARIMFAPAASVEDKHAAQTIFIAVASGLLGYLVKK